MEIIKAVRTDNRAAIGGAALVLQGSVAPGHGLQVAVPHSRAWPGSRETAAGRARP
ncbi:hypothetical protein [Herbidospora galbida]|uniref:hypothetical protein n=1 Tax=Herbidospora galbida TaxID=2575442 RepID=UPI00148543AC|nr:hypothetical protein [Herbidospora galbida]